VSKQASWTLGICGTRAVVRIGALVALTFAAAGIAQAQSAAPAPAKTEDSSLTWKGITLYGIIDVGVQYQTHGTPISDYFPAGTAEPLQKNSNGSVTAVTPSNLSQSRIGLSGNEPLFGDWAAVFRLETFFNPQSGNLSDALKSIALNNGRDLHHQTTNVDSSVAGQAFAGAAYAGFASQSLGTLTFGRHVTPLADGISKYDPMGAAQAFSLIGFSGTYAGGGDTEDRRLDQSVKYTGKFDFLHVGALYQFSGASGSANTATQFQLGAEFAGFSADAYYAKKYNAVAASPMSAAQVSGLATLCADSVNPTPPATPNPSGALCFSPSNSVVGTISDNTTYALMAMYSLPTVKFYASYEHIQFASPKTPLDAGTIIIGGYVLAYTNNKAYEFNDKTLNVVWAGVKWTPIPALDLVAAYYGYNQNSYGKTACSDNSKGTCSGKYQVGSVLLNYRLSKRFDVYLGSMYSTASDGPASGFINTNTLATTAGLRFKF
jgi:predicted porin